jgi:hypothetical protein
VARFSVCVVFSFLSHCRRAGTYFWIFRPTSGLFAAQFYTVSTTYQFCIEILSRFDCCSRSTQVPRSSSFQRGLAAPCSSTLTTLASSSKGWRNCVLDSQEMECGMRCRCIWRRRASFITTRGWVGAKRSCDGHPDRRTAWCVTPRSFMVAVHAAHCYSS